MIDIVRVLRISVLAVLVCALLGKACKGVVVSCQSRLTERLLLKMWMNIFFK